MKLDALDAPRILDAIRILKLEKKTRLYQASTSAGLIVRVFSDDFARDTPAGLVRKCSTSLNRAPPWCSGVVFFDANVLTNVN